jgi:hypothetical protein
MLASVDAFIFEEILGTSRLDGVNQRPLCVQPSQRRHKVFSGQAKKVLGEGVGRSKDDEAIGGIPLPYLPVTKGITAPSPLKIDVRSNNPF